MKMILLLSLIFIVSCEEEKKTARMQMTADQNKYYESLTIEQRLIIDGCLDTRYNTFSGCIIKMKKVYCFQSTSSGNSSLLPFAAGAAVGIGASRVISRPQIRTGK